MSQRRLEKESKIKKESRLAHDNAGCGATGPEEGTIVCRWPPPVSTFASASLLALTTKPFISCLNLDEDQLVDTDYGEHRRSSRLPMRCVQRQARDGPHDMSSRGPWS